MRNLKKILALVLALVMSLSLMATASAADFTDADSINEKYETAIEVLEGLGVFKGYQDGTFQPTGSITRAETAAIIYRIVTGDVKDEQVGIYADYNIFTDVPSTSWFAGYVNFCANAEYIKGMPDGTFKPNQQVTGYAALAMILRAIGYTANGGFTGSDWEVQTARTAEARKITKNIMTGTLGQPASRETVAEILFQAILVNMVDHNVDNTFNGNQGYFETDMSLGYKTFKLEEVTGVVVANEYANLYDTVVLGKDKTQLEDYDGNVRSLDVTTALTDVGESRYAYVTGTKVLSKVLNTNTNKTYETGDAITAAKAISEVGTAKSGDTEYYVNFDRDGIYTCDQRLEFVVTFEYKANETYKPDGITKYTTLQEIISDFQNTYANGADLNATTANGGVGMTIVDGAESLGSTKVTFSKIIRAGSDISALDLAVIRGIFVAADNNNDSKTLYQGVEGDVFVGTYSNPIGTTYDERDLSNTISYKKFFETYINADVYDINWEKSGNGEWVKTVDYNSDGIVDYVFLTQYWLDEAVNTYTKNDETVLVYNTLSETSNAYSVRYLEDVTVGDVVIYSMIDGQALVELAKHEDKTVQSYSWKEDEITTTDGDIYGQSAIFNNTEMQELIQNMDNTVEYTLYFDKYGHVRAYKLPGGTQYALVTEIYALNGNNGNLVQDWPLTTELTYLNADGVKETKEYNLTGGSRSQLFNGSVFTLVGSDRGTYSYYNYLQPAIAHLGVTRTDNRFSPAYLGADVTEYATTLFGSYNWTFWPDNNQIVKSINALNGKEFDYGAYTWTDSTDTERTSTDTTSFTNVAVVNFNGDNATLTGAAQLKLNSDGTVATRGGKPVYSRDYVQLSTDKVAKGAVRYAINGAGTYVAENNYYVNAVNTTKFYIVYDGGVEYFEGYASMPALNADTVGRIHAAYAVAHDTSADNADKPYWVADVIVYEVESWNSYNAGSISLAYYTPNRATGSIQEIDTINGANGLVQLTPTNKAWDADKGQWGRDWEDYGFYRLYNETAPENGVMTAGKIEKITAGNYNKNGIYAGILTREVRLAEDGLYIDINTSGVGVDGTRVNAGTAANPYRTDTSLKLNDNIYSITEDTKWNGYNIVRNVAEKLFYSNYSDSRVKAGDRVIWLGGSLNGTALSSSNFIVDLGNDVASGVDANIALRNATPNWLWMRPYANGGTDSTDATIGNGLWKEIWTETSRDTSTDAYEITAKVVDAAGADMTGATVTVAPTSALISSAPAGIQLTAITLGGTADGMDITNVTVTNNKSGQAGKNATAIKGANGNWVLINIEGDVELAITAEPATYELKIAALPTGGAAITNVTLAEIGTTGETGHVAANATWTGTAVNAKRGAAYSITLNSPVAGYTYNVTGGNAVIDHDTNIITGTMTEDTELTITAVQETVTVTLDETSANVSMTAPTGAAATLNVGANLNTAGIVLAPTAGYTLTAADIEVTVGSTKLAASQVTYNAGTGAVTLPSYVLAAGDNIVVKAVASAAAFTVKVSDVAADADGLVGLTTDPALDSDDVAYGSSITVTAADATQAAAVWYTMGDTTKHKITFDALSLQYTIENVTGDVTFYDNGTAL